MDEGGSFTIDFIEEEHRENVKLVSQILCISLKQAYQLYFQSGYNVQAAIHHKTNPISEHQFVSPSNQNNNQRNRRNVAFHHEINNLQHDFDDNDDDQFNYLPQAPLARRGLAIPRRVEQQCQFDVKFNKYLQFKQKKKTFQARYPVRKTGSQQSSMSISMKLFNKKPTKKNQESNSGKRLLQLDPFIKKIERGLLEKKCFIKFGKGTMSQSLHSSFRSTQPLILYHLSFDKVVQQVSKQNQKKTKPPKKAVKQKKMCIDITQDNSNQKIIEVQEKSKEDLSAVQFRKTKKNQLLSSLLLDSKVTNVVNNAFLNYIFDVQSYQFETYLRAYFPKQLRSQSFLLILRVNTFDQIQRVDKIFLDPLITKEELKIQNKQAQSQALISQVLQQLRLIKNKVTQQQTQQNHLRQRYRLLQQGIYHYQYKKPPTTIQKKKIKQDRQLIKMQQQQFYNMQNEFRQQQQKQIEQQIQIATIKTKQDILFEREKIRKQLKKYKEGQQSQQNVMTIKFRLPSGKNILTSVSVKQKVSYLFDFINSHQSQSLGFEQEQEKGYCQRKFDLVRPLDRMSLEDKFDQTLQQVFEGSQMESLQVKEK